jgi:hypothetical protein
MRRRQTDFWFTVTPAMIGANVAIAFANVLACRLGSPVTNSDEVFHRITSVIGTWRLSGPRPRNVRTLGRKMKSSAFLPRGASGNKRKTRAAPWRNGICANTDELPDDLAGAIARFHPSCPWRNEDTGKITYLPTLVVPFRSVDDDAITGIHRIALEPFIAKPKRRMRGIVYRAAIKFDPISERLVVGEGVETCMAAREMGYRPIWALGSTGNISFFPIMENVKTLLILGERGDASTEAINVCGTRWRKAGRRVRVVMPDLEFSDLNDVLMAERRRDCA